MLGTLYAYNDWMGKVNIFLQMIADRENFLGRAPLAHACNPSYSGGRYQKDHGPKPALGK
jgi:hypothetical protein